MPSRKPMPLIPTLYTTAGGFLIWLALLSLVHALG